MKITDVFNGYCDAEEYGVVVRFQVDGKENGAYVTFDRQTKEIDSIVFHEGDDAVEVPQPAGVVLAEIESAARAFLPSNE